MMPETVTKRPSDKGLCLELQAYRRDRSLWISKAEQLLHCNNIDQAKLVLETVLEDDPSIPASLLLVKACLRQGVQAYPEAVAVARRTASRIAGCTGIDQGGSCQLTLAVALGSSARVPQLSELSKSQIRAEAMDCISHIAASATCYPKAEYNKGLLLAESGQVDAALQHVSTALQLASADADNLLITLCLVLIAALLSARQQPHSALQVLEAVPSPQEGTYVCTAEVLAVHVKAKLLIVAGDPQGAVATLLHCKRRLSSSVPSNSSHSLPTPSSSSASPASYAKVWQDLALLFAEQGDASEASFCVDQLQKLQPWHADTYYTHGCVLEASGDHAGAINSYNLALTTDPTHAVTLIKLGAAYARKGTTSNLAVAKELLTDGLRYDPGNVQGWQQLGLVAKALGHFEQAEQSLFAAVSLASQLPIVSYSSLPFEL